MKISAHKPVEPASPLVKFVRHPPERREASVTLAGGCCTTCCCCCCCVQTVGSLAGAFIATNKINGGDIVEGAPVMATPYGAGIESARLLSSSFTDSTLAVPIYWGSLAVIVVLHFIASMTRMGVGLLTIMMIFPLYQLLASVVAVFVLGFALRYRQNDNRKIEYKALGLITKYSVMGTLAGLALWLPLLFLWL